MTVQDSRSLPAWSEKRGSLLDSLLVLSKNLCLDAPLVALVWQEFLARVWDAPVQPGHRLTLACITWLAYMGDRLLDGPRQGQQGRSERHSFAWTHRPGLQAAWIGMALLGAALVYFLLPVTDWIPGFLFFAGLALYCLAARTWPRLIRGIVPRELLVGIFFSIACSLFVFTTLGQLPVTGVLLALAFALLCSLDCWAISCTDRDRDLLQGEWNLVTSYAWAWRAFPQASLCYSASILAISLFLPVAPARFLQAIALSGLLLFAITRFLGMSRRLTLYADLTLMSPLLFLVVT